MEMLNFLDANVWLALIWERHAHSATARAWFQGQKDSLFLFCRLTQLTALRLLTTAAIMGDDVCSMKDAWIIWDTLASDKRIAYLPEPDDLEPSFREGTQLPSASPKVWVDSYLVAFARTAGLRLVTFDKALGARAPGATVLS